MTTLRPSVDLIGMLVALPECTTTVSPQVGGWVQKVLVVEGATVQAGDELVLLDTRLADVAVAKAQAAVAEKEATLARLKRGYLPQELEIARYEVEKCRETADSLRGRDPSTGAVAAEQRNFGPPVSEAGFFAPRRGSRPRRGGSQVAAAASRHSARGNRRSGIPRSLGSDRLGGGEAQPGTVPNRQPNCGYRHGATTRGRAHSSSGPLRC